MSTTIQPDPTITGKARSAGKLIYSLTAGRSTLTCAEIKRVAVIAGQLFDYAEQSAAVVLRQDDGYWAVAYHGRLVLRDESFTVADRLRDALNGDPLDPCGEVEEMADAIKAAGGQ